MRRFVFFVIFFIPLVCSCKSKYEFWKDERIIADRKDVEKEWKFVLTVYYNSPSIYFDEPLQLGQIRDGVYEHTVDYVFYERSFFQFFAKVFEEPPVEIKDEKERETYLYNLHSLCDVKDRNGNVIFWYSYDENEADPYMLLNGHLIKKNQKLLAFARILLETEVVEP